MNSTRTNGFLRGAGRLSRLSCLLAVPLLSCGAEPPPTTPPPDLVITGATLIDGTGAEPRPDTTILITDGRITAVAPDEDVDAQAGGAVIDARGKYVTPGLADMHTHFSLGAPLPRRDDETRQVLARQLYYGVTTILQLGATDGSPEAIQELRRLRKEGILQAPKVYGTGGHLTIPGTHPVYTIFPPRVRDAADAMAAATPTTEPVNLFSLGIGLTLVRTEEAAGKAVRERGDRGMDAIKITVESGPTPFGDDHPQMSVEMIRAIVEESERYGLPVLAHATSLDELESSFEGGADGIVHAVRNRPLPDRVLADQLAAAHFFVVPTLTLYAEPGDLEDPFLVLTASNEERDALGRPEFLARAQRRWECCAAFDELLANIGMLHERGVPMVLGTDTGNPFVFPGYSAHRELELLVQAGLTPMQAIESATRRAAEMIGAQDDFGTVEPGKRADLLILGANPLADIRNTRALQMVVSEGRVIDREALLQSIAGAHE